MPDLGFRERLQSHQGGLVRVLYSERRRLYMTAREVHGKIGLLVSLKSTDYSYSIDSAMVELLIDGSVKMILLYPGELEFLGADDA
jgi:hypothetical protein